LVIGLCTCSRLQTLYKNAIVCHIPRYLLGIPFWKEVGGGSSLLSPSSLPYFLLERYAMDSVMMPLSLRQLFLLFRGLVVIPLSYEPPNPRLRWPPNYSRRHAHVLLCCPCSSHCHSCSGKHVSMFSLAPYSEFNVIHCSYLKNLPIV
jgi:hypothetical protein